MPRRDADRQEHQRGERAYDEADADRLERLVEDVLADLVGAQHVVVLGEEGDRQRDGQDREQGRPGGVPRHARVAPSQPSHREADGQSEHTGEHEPQADPRQHVPREIGFVLEMRAAIAQPRKIAHGLAVELHLLLGVEARGERRRVRALAPLAQVRKREVEDRKRLDRVHRRRAGGPGGLQAGPVVQRIGEADRHIAGDDYGGHDRRFRLEHALPRRGEVRPASAIPGIGGDGGEEQPHQHVGIQREWHYCSLIRGSTSV